MPEPRRISIVIATKDEALHIERCIESVRELGPVFVVDSGSFDETVELARASGATVVDRPWLGYAAQKNWALENLPLETDWVLFLDADERLTEELRGELTAAAGSDDVVGYHVARENVVLGRALRHAWWYPDYQLRLFRRGRARFEERLVHEHPVVDGPTEYLEHPLVHENLKGLGAFVERHLRYAELEAREIRSGRSEGSFLGSRAERRRALKTKVWYRLPFRPAIRFAWMYVVRRGFLDGREGRAYCQLIAAYEALIDAALLEAELADRRSPHPTRATAPREAS